MILLRQLFIDIRVPRNRLYPIIKCNPRTLVRMIDHGIFPKYEKRRLQIMEQVEKYINNNPAALKWLSDHNKEICDIWEEYTGEYTPAPRGNFGFLKPVLGDPSEIEEREDIEMITSSTMKHFKLFKNPFLNDIVKHQDIYLSAEHRFLKEMMLDAARYGGFVAVVGGVGSGKSIMRKAVAEQLIADEIKIVFPVLVDKAVISPSSLVDAIIMDISDETPKRSLEQKTRQAVRLLKARMDNDMKQVLMIEEAHTIDKRAFKALKQIYELEVGFERLIGIILIGQPELLKKLDEVSNPDIREVIRRITTAEIEGLGKDVEAYLQFKFARIGKKAGDVFDDGVYEAINKKLERVRGRRVINRSFPLSVNNLVARAMNTAAQMGETKITTDLIMSC